jgi:hypothetical protein
MKHCKDCPDTIACSAHEECLTYAALSRPYNNDAGEPPSPRKPDLPRYSARNASRADHIARLRVRIKNLHSMTAKQELRGVLQGILDLLEDDGS